MDNLQFKVSSAVKDLVGRDLIRNDNIAIFELVKNSYDAYATKVEITFEPKRIIIADNGKGMSFYDLRDKWLFLAYSAKKDGSEDSEDDKQKSYRDNINRHFAGAKGVGRFSCDRLGAKLVVTTKSQKDKNAEQLTIDWTAFEKDQKKEFIEVDVQHESLSALPKFPENKETGTILEITNLRSIWARDEIFELRKALEKLINPFSESNDFSIEIICDWLKQSDEKERSSTKIKRKIVNGIINNSISQVISIKTTKIDVILNKDYIETAIIDRGIEIYRIREKNIFNKLNSVNINLYFLNHAAKTAFSMKMGVQPVQYGSIFLFRNGFRILPFGNPGDDSWKLDYRAQQGYNRFIGTRDLFGRVDIQTDNINEFKEVSSRDGGLIESETTLQLKHLFEITHHRLERYVTGVLWGEGFLKRQYFKDVANVEKNRAILRKDKELDSADYVITSSLGSKIDFVQLVKTLISDKNIEVLSYNKALANIFSEPTLFDDANPQVITDLERIAEKTKDGDLMSSIDEAKQKIIELQKQKELAEQKAEEATIRAAQAEEDRNKAQYEAKVAKVKQEKAEKENKELHKHVDRITSENLFLTSDVSKDVKQLSALQHHITHTSSFIHSLAMKALDAINSDDKEKTIKFINQILFENTKIVTLSNFVSKAKFDLMAKKITKDIVNFVNEYMLNVYAISNKDEIQIHVEETKIKNVMLFAPIDFIVVLDSLLDNSKKAKAKNVFIKWKECNESVEFHFSDDGKGIPDEYLPKIFNYRFTTTGGGGLGLYHVSEICKKMNIDIKVNNKNIGTEFIFVFAKEK
ncbi:MAG: ATP-binding protein [Spirochaetales bacterium]|nr:ATP-binding protein [Spirochaetales bacterium]